MYPAETKEMQYQTKKKNMYWYVLSTYQHIPFYEPEVFTGYILLTSSLYFKTYISYQYVQVCHLQVGGESNGSNGSNVLGSNEFM
jgi:hypothetical protein